MNPNTGAIATFETDEDAKAAGHTVPLSKKLAGRMLAMARASRVALVKSWSTAHPLARVPGESDEDARKARNAAKRERGARG